MTQMPRHAAGGRKATSNSGSGSSVTAASRKSRKPEPASAAKLNAQLHGLLDAIQTISSASNSRDAVGAFLGKAAALSRAERCLVMIVDGDLARQSPYTYYEDPGKDWLVPADKRENIIKQVAASGTPYYGDGEPPAESKPQAKQAGIPSSAAVVCLPLRSLGKAFGCCYFERSGTKRATFSQRDLLLLELVVRFATAALTPSRSSAHSAGCVCTGAHVAASAPVGIVLIDARCRVASINAAALEVFDLNRDSVVTIDSGREPSNFLELLPETVQPRWQYLISMALSTREEYSDHRFFHHTGYVEKVLSVRVTPMSGEDLDVNHLIVVVEDITNSVLMEKYLILSEKLVAKGEMATAVAHELGGHLTTAADNAEQLSASLDRNQPDKAKEHCQEILNSVSQIRHFVDNLIDFSKPHTEYISYDIRLLIEDLLFSLRIQPRFRQTHFTINLSRDIPNMEIDVGQIQQVLMNILNNAADAIEEKAIEYQTEGCQLKREIEIQASYDDVSETVMIDITDNGVGMTEETLGKVFEKHFSTKKSGHGLGLFNCRKIVEQHNGEIEAQSTYGEGTTFSIYLPRWQPRKES